MTGLWEAAQGLDTTWMRDATCGRYTALPWTESLRKVPNRTIALMGMICSQCPVRDQCATYAVKVDVHAGWWAGVNLNRLRWWEHPTPDLFRDARSWGDAA